MSEGRADPALRLRSARLDGDARAWAATAAVARACVHHVVEDEATLLRALAVFDDWCARRVQRDALAAVAADVAAARARADADDDRGAYLALESCDALYRAALEGFPEVSARLLWHACRCAMEALAWPDHDDDDIVRGVIARVDAVIDEAMPRRSLSPATRRA